MRANARGPLQAMTKITPHKGGRSERLYARIRPETKRRLAELCEVQVMTVADFIESAVNRSYEAEPEVSDMNKIKQQLSRLGINKAQASTGVIGKGAEAVILRWNGDEEWVDAETLRHAEQDPDGPASRRLEAFEDVNLR